MPDYRHILLEKDASDHIAKLTLNRPERLNALNDLMIDEIGDAVEDVSSDDSMRVLILTGAGRAFCSGGDLQTLIGGNEPGSLVSDNSDDIRRGFEHIQKFVLGIHRMEKPVIAMVNGVAAGAGFDMTCVCDIRVGCPQSRFMSAYVRIGLFPGFGGTWLYPRALGSISKAAEMLFTGDSLEAEEAHRVGLLNHLVPSDQLRAKTMEIATTIAKNRHESVIGIKQILLQDKTADLRGMWENERDYTKVVKGYGVEDAFPEFIARKGRA